MKLLLLLLALLFSIAFTDEGRCCRIDCLQRDGYGKPGPGSAPFMCMQMCCPREGHNKARMDICINACVNGDWPK